MIKINLKTQTIKKSFKNWENFHICLCVVEMAFIHKVIESNLAIKNMKVKKLKYLFIFLVTYWNIMYNLAILSNLNIIFKIW
jgi:hypothetical protein